MYKGDNRRKKNILDVRGRRYTLAYCILIVATTFYLIVPLIWIAFGWLDGKVFIECLMYFTILMGTNVLAFIAGISYSKKYQNGSVTK